MHRPVCIHFSFPLPLKPHYACSTGTRPWERVMVYIYSKCIVISIVVVVVMVVLISRPSIKSTYLFTTIKIRLRCAFDV